MEGKGQGQEMQAVPVMLMPQPMDEEEINLLDLWRMLVRSKWLVISIAGASVVAGLVYALLTPLVYRAEAWLLPPSEKNVQGYTPEKVYDLFIRNLKSRSLRRHFFNEHKLADRLAPDRKPSADFNRIFDGFNKSLSVSRDKALVRVSFEGRDARLAAQWVNGIVAEANKATARILAVDVASKLENSKRGLRDLQEKLARLESVHIDPSRISAVQIDQVAEIPDRHIKPKRKLIVMLSLFGGLMLGFFAAFFSEFLDKARREQPSETAA